ncbi:hypothetical protein PYCC9005_000984 [Savitreella phatthalungensis]
MSSIRFISCVLALVVLSGAHEHVVSDVPENAVISNAPIDKTLWLHITVMMVAFGVLYPLGMVFGMTRSRWHVPTQIVASGLAVFGVLLGHTPRTGRQFQENIHAKFAPWLIIFLIAQVALGVYLKLHLQRGLMKHVHRALVPLHGLMGKLFPVLSYIQMGFGGITALGFCRNATGDHLGQCLAHGIMGSAFIGYGIVMLVMLNAYQWLAARRVSQETIDSWVIMIWGLVNTFTEHRFGSEWSHKDLQHTSMGIIWFCAGIAGVYLGQYEGRPRRNIIPALVIFVTGWGMANHKQSLILSTNMHAIFGYTLMAAGAMRVVEVAIVLRDSARDSKRHPRSFQYLTPFLLIASGLLFMCSNEEQILMINDAMIDHVSYSLIILSTAFLVFFWANFLIGMYNTTGVNGDAREKEMSERRGFAPLNGRGGEHGAGGMHGGLDDDERDLENGHRGIGIGGGDGNSNSQQISGITSRGYGQPGPETRYDQDEFELGLMSDEDEDAPASGLGQPAAGGKMKNGGRGAAGVAGTMTKKQNGKQTSNQRERAD